MLRLVLLGTLSTSLLVSTFAYCLSASPPWHIIDFGTERRDYNNSLSKFGVHACLHNVCACARVPLPLLRRINPQDSTQDWDINSTTSARANTAQSISQPSAAIDLDDKDPTALNNPSPTIPTLGAEETATVINPLQTALQLFGFEHGGVPRALTILDSANNVMLIARPRDFLNAAVTGLAGDYLLPQKFTVGTGDNKQTFRARETLHWEVRWDHDERHGRGPHVNAQFGTRPLSKFAYYLHESKYIQIPPEIPAEWKKETSNQMFQRLSNKVKYPMNHNAGKTTPAFRKRAIMPNNDIDPVINEQCRLDTINVLKEYFKAVAAGTADIWP